jgi:deazaflavin-dependent oxidoreductase (nitroreductase family)
MLPWFSLVPPSGWGALATVGRKTGKTRRRCIRAIRRGDRVVVVSIPGGRAAWLKNVRANPTVRLRIKGGAFTGVARELTTPSEIQEAMEAYCDAVNRVDYVACALHRRGWPNRAKIRRLHRTWFDQGVPLLIELGREAPWWTSAR